MNYLIIGGVAGGATVAARLRRMDEKANIVLFERGKYVSYANCGLPYYIGDTINNREKLFVQTVRIKKKWKSRTYPLVKFTPKHTTNWYFHREPNRSDRVSKGSEARRYSLSAMCRTPIRSRITSISKSRNALSLWGEALSDWKWRKIWRKKISA